MSMISYCLVSFKIICNYHGFTKNKITESALTELINVNVDILDKNKIDFDVFSNFS